MDYLAPLATILLCTLSIQAKSYHHPAGYYNPAPVGHDGRVVDTPEVAQAKAAHLAAFSQVATRPNHPAAAAPHHPQGAQPVGAYSNPGFFSSRIEHGPYGYQGPPAPLANDGRVVDTPEVEQAKAAHFAAFNQAASRSYDAPAPRANNPPNPQAYNDDSDNNSNYNNNEDYSDYSAGNYSGDDDEDSSGSSEEGNYEGDSSSHYQGPPAPLAQDGRVIDTPEVARAKAAHLAAIQREAQKSHHAPRSYYDY